MQSSGNEDINRPPWYARKLTFWLFSLFCLSWPIRMIIERRTAYATFTIHKQVSTQVLYLYLFSVCQEHLKLNFACKGFQFGS